MSICCLIFCLSGACRFSFYKGNVYSEQWYENTHLFKTSSDHGNKYFCIILLQNSFFFPWYTLVVLLNRLLYIPLTVKLKLLGSIFYHTNNSSSLLFSSLRRCNLPVTSFHPFKHEFHTWWPHSQRMNTDVNCGTGYDNDKTSLVIQWLRIHLVMQGTPVWSLVPEDSTYHGTTKSMHTTTEVCVSRSCALYKRSQCNEKAMHWNEE